MGDTDSIEENDPVHSEGNDSFQQCNISEKEEKTWNSFADIDNLLSELSSKYGSKDSALSYSTEPNQNLKLCESKPIDYFNDSGIFKKITPIIILSDSDEEIDNRNLYIKYLDGNATTATLNFVSVSDSESDGETYNLEKLKAQNCSKITKDEKTIAKKTLQEEKRIQKKSEKAQELKTKEMKKMANQASKRMKPDECLKQVELIICNSLSKKPLAKEIFNLFHENEIKYSQQSQIYSNCITWRRISQSYLMQREQLINKTNTEDCGVILFILECNDFVAMIENDYLIGYFTTVREIMPTIIIYLGLFGVNEYLRMSKNQKLRNIKTGVPNTKSKTSGFAMYDRSAVETNLTKLQVLLAICYRYLDTAHDVAALVNHMTKAIAQTPYKLKKRQQFEQAGHYIIGDNKDCVLVDKSGHGLSRLWQQNITSFPLARLDLAESVMATYPTFKSLMQAYERCAHDAEREQLLENLEIRRAAGPLTNFRKIGPDFSKKIFKYYNSRESDMIL